MSDAWRDVALEDVAHIQQGKTLAVKDMTGGEHPVFGANGVIGHYHSGHYEHPVVAVGCRGSCGTVRIAPSGAFLANNVMAVWPKDDEVTLEVLALLLERADLRGQGVITGQVQPQITRRALAPLRVALPPSDVQKVAAKVAEKFDAATRAYRAQEASARQALGAVGAASWDHPVRKPLGRLGKAITGQTPSTKSPELWEPATVPFLTPGDFDCGLQLSETARAISAAGAASVRVVPAASVVQVCIGATLGKVGVTSQTCAANQQINAVIGLDKLDALFVAAALLASQGQAAVWARAGRTTLPILKKSAWEAVEVPWPDPEERAQIGAVVNALDHLLQRSARAAEAVNRARSAALSEVLTASRSQELVLEAV